MVLSGLAWAWLMRTFIDSYERGSGGTRCTLLHRRPPDSTRKTQRIRPAKPQDPVIRLHHDFRSKSFDSREPGYRTPGILFRRPGRRSQQGLLRLRDFPVLVKWEVLDVRYENLRIPALLQVAEFVGEVVRHGSDQHGRTRGDRYACHLIAQILARCCKPTRINPGLSVIRHTLHDATKIVTRDGPGPSAEDPPQRFRLLECHRLDSESGIKRLCDLLV